MIPSIWTGFAAPSGFSLESSSCLTSLSLDAVNATELQLVADVDALSVSEALTTAPDLKYGPSTFQMPLNASLAKAMDTDWSSSLAEPTGRKTSMVFGFAVDAESSC